MKTKMIALLVLSIAVIFVVAFFFAQIAVPAHHAIAFGAIFATVTGVILTRDVINVIKSHQKV